MIWIARSIAASATLLLLGLSPGMAGTYGDAPWCAVVDTGVGAMEWDCEYASAAACRSHVLGGNRGFCERNPYYESYESSPPAGPHRWRR